MKNTFRLLATMLMIAAMITGCKKSEEQPVPGSTAAGPQQVPSAPMQQMPMGGMPGQIPGQAPMPPHGDSASMTPKVEKTVVVPDSVKGKWSKVILVVVDKGSNKSTEYTVKLKGDLKIPNTGLKVAVGDFLPDFKMSDTTLTSASNEPNNPALRVEVFEGGKSIFKGWLYSKFPTMHPFEHPKYAIILKEGVRA